MTDQPDLSLLLDPARKGREGGGRVGREGGGWGWRREGEGGDGGGRGEGGEGGGRVGREGRKGRGWGEREIKPQVSEIMSSTYSGSWYTNITFLSLQKKKSDKEE